MKKTVSSSDVKISPSPVVGRQMVWEVGWTKNLHQLPSRFVTATVPGAVQLDWAKAEGWPPYWQGVNFRNYAWMEDVYWVYRARLVRPAMAAARVSAVRFPVA